MVSAKGGDRPLGADGKPLYPWDSLEYGAQSFPGGDGTVGGAPRSATVRPNEPYNLEAEGGQPGEGIFSPIMSSVGGMRVLSPSWSGIQDAAQFRPLGADTSKARKDADEVADDEDESKSTRKSVRKSSMGHGFWSSAVFRNGDNAAGYIGE